MLIFSVGNSINSVIFPPDLNASRNLFDYVSIDPNGHQLVRVGTYLKLGGSADWFDPRCKLVGLLPA